MTQGELIAHPVEVLKPMRNGEVNLKLKKCGFFADVSIVSYWYHDYAG